MTALRPLIILFAAACVAGFDAAPCRAQWSFGFSYSDGYRGHHHHHHGHWGYYGWYRPAPSYVYVAPPPPTIYVPVATTTIPVAQPNLSLSSTATTVPAVATTAQQPSTAAAPTAQVRANPLPAYQGSGVTIRNPAGSGARVSFVVDDTLQLDLEPGESTPLKEKNSYSVAFDRGGDFGTSRRVLGEGTYEFVATETGWELRRDALKTAHSEGPTEPVVRRNELPAPTLR